MTVNSLRRRRTQYAIGIAVWLCMVALGAAITWAPRPVIAIIDVLLLAALIILVDGGGSIYKIAVMFRHRKESDTRELIASSTQSYPRVLRQFLMDEEEKQESDPSGGPISSERGKFQ